ncbi:hypothetical protein AC579_6187 [Pseudocercospora musae]|uniref:Uncharacterized protein n=1 Tax=Pseudocercospora musae TaxID=113226 RepID=A0A139IRX8_9PEZI|nr:hypothetical protein AC579_6187 [Pseudocercospora musae]
MHMHSLRQARPGLRWGHHVRIQTRGDRRFEPHLRARAGLPGRKNLHIIASRRFQSHPSDHILVICPYLIRKSSTNIRARSTVLRTGAERGMSRKFNTGC